MNKSTINVPSAGTKADSSTTAQNQHVRQPNANTNVSGSLFKYIEIKEYENGKVVKRIDVSNESDHNMDKIESGMNINLNHEKYYTFSYDSEVKLETV